MVRLPIYITNMLDGKKEPIRTNLTAKHSCSKIRLSNPLSALSSQLVAKIQRHNIKVEKSFLERRAERNDYQDCPYSCCSAYSFSIHLVSLNISYGGLLLSCKILFPKIYTNNMLEK